MKYVQYISERTHTFTIGERVVHNKKGPGVITMLCNYPDKPLTALVRFDGERGMYGNHDFTTSTEVEVAHLRSERPNTAKMYGRRRRNRLNEGVRLKDFPHTIGSTVTILPIPNEIEGQEYYSDDYKQYWGKQGKIVAIMFNWGWDGRAGYTVYNKDQLFRYMGEEPDPVVSYVYVQIWEDTQTRRIYLGPEMIGIKPNYGRRRRNKLNESMTVRDFPYNIGDKVTIHEMPNMIDGVDNQRESIRKYAGQVGTIIGICLNFRWSGGDRRPGTEWETCYRKDYDKYTADRLDEEVTYVTVMMDDEVKLHVTPEVIYEKPDYGIRRRRFNENPVNEKLGVSDDVLKLSRYILDILTGDMGEYNMVELTVDKMAEIIDVSKYPRMADVQLRRLEEGKKRGYWRSSDNTLAIKRLALSTVAHEVNHMLQDMAKPKLVLSSDIRMKNVFSNMEDEETAKHFSRMFYITSKREIASNVVQTYVHMRHIKEKGADISDSTVFREELKKTKLYRQIQEVKATVSKLKEILKDESSMLSFTKAAIRQIKAYTKRYKVPLKWSNVDENSITEEFAVNFVRKNIRTFEQRILYMTTKIGKLYDYFAK